MLYFMVLVTCGCGGNSLTSVDPRGSRVPVWDPVGLRLLQTRPHAPARRIVPGFCRVSRGSGTAGTRPDMSTIQGAPQSLNA